MSYKLKVIPPNNLPYEVAIEGEDMTLGRSPKVDLTLADQAISRRHARLFHTDGETYLEDLNSNNGTWLGTLQVRAPTRVSRGQVIRLAAGDSSDGGIYRIQIIEAPGVPEDSDIRERGLHKNALQVLEEATLMPEETFGEEELYDYAQRFHLLNGVHAALAHPVSENQLLDLILDRVFEHLKPDAGIIYLQNEDGELERAARRVRPGYKEKPLHSKTLVHELMEEGQALLVNDVSSDSFFENAMSLRGAHIRSLLATPMMDQEGTIGMIVLYSGTMTGIFKEHDLELLVQLAAIATLRMRNIRLMDMAARQLLDVNRMLEQEVRKRTKEMENLERIVATINREHELDKVLETVLELGFVMFPIAEKGSVLLWDDAKEHYYFSRTRGFGDALDNITLTREEAVARYIEHADVLAEGVYLVTRYEGLPDSDKFLHLPLPASMVALTLIVGDKLSGFLIMGAGDEDNAFSFHNANILSRYREHAAMAVARALLIIELEKEHQENRRRENRIQVQERKAMLSQLTGGVAHGVNNANNSVRNGLVNLNSSFNRFKEFLFGIMEDDADPKLHEAFAGKLDGLQDQIRHILKGSDRIHGFIKDLQLVMQIKEGPLERRCLMSNLVSILHLFEAGYPEIEFRFNRPVADWYVMCSATDIARAYAAILTNACEAIQERRQAEPRAPSIITITGDIHDGSGVIAFTDTGCGVPESIRKKVFSPSVTSRPDSRLGLGLSITYNIITGLSGKIEIDSEVGKGTAVTLTIPLLQ